MARRRSMAARRPPSFFMVLIEDDFSDQLIIPLAFHKHFDGKVPHQSLLRTPARSWKVNVKKVNDRMFFQKGWKRFAHDNGLKMKEFLVFHYAGNSEFDVEIFGTDSCKRGSAMGIGQSDRPLDEEGHGNGIHRKCPRSKHVGSSTRYGKHNVDDQGGTSAAGTRTRQAIKKVIAIDSETSDFEASESEEAFDSETSVSEEASDSETSESQTSMHIDEPDTDQLSEDSKIQTSIHTDEPGTDQLGEATALERANAFKRENVLFGGEGNPQQRINSMSQNLKRYETSLSEAYESEISESETDELSGDSEIGLPRDQLGSRKNLSWVAAHARALEAAKKYSSSIRYPSFISVLKNTYVHKGQLHIPKSFMDQIGRSVNVKVQVSEEMWLIRCVHDRYASRLSAGWLNVVKYHDLKVGDVCVFGLIGRDDVPVIKVSFFRC